jgi:outer membrane protein assembly factor BamD (BamD/ComL family)
VRIQASLLRDAYLQLEKLKNERDSSVEAEKLRFFRIGELFRFELNEPDSAYKRYITIVQHSPDSFKIVPMALSAAAFVAKNDLKNLKRADSLFRMIIKKFPASDYGKLAQRELSQPITILTRQDSAYQAFRNAEILLYGKEPNVKNAISAYYNVFRTYPDIDIAQKSLFTAAWLIDEILQKNKTARDLYAKLCKKYPESIYCKNEAKPRLDAVEKVVAELKKNRPVPLQTVVPNKESVSTVPSKGGNVKDSTSGTIPDTIQQSTNTALDDLEPDKDSLDSPISDEPDTTLSAP